MEARQAGDASNFLVVTGPSGAGKSTLLRRILDDGGGVFRMSVSYTTRRPRPGESDGVHYRFVSEGEFLSRAERGLFLEYSRYGGNYYGTPACRSADADRSVTVFDVDLDGFEFFRRNFPGAFFCLVTADRETVAQRLRGRRVAGGGLTDEGELRRRMEYWDRFEDIRTGEYSGWIIDNSGDLEAAYGRADEMAGAVLRHCGAVHPA